MAFAKGAVVLSTLEFARSAAGDAAVARILGRLPEAERQRFGSIGATDPVALADLYRLWHAADAELEPADPSWMEQAGAHSIESAGVQLYGGIVRKPTPLDFLTQPVSLFRLFYQTGSMEIVEREAARAVLRLVGFPTGDPLFCRRQTGGLRRAVELAGGVDVQARHVRCEGAGDAFCEWELRWSAPSTTDTERRGAPRTRPPPAVVR